MLNFEEHKKTGYSIWSVDDDSDKDGKVIHVWGGEYDNKPSRAFAFERQSNGTYIIRDRTVEKETEKKDIKNRTAKTRTTIRSAIRVRAFRGS